MHRRPLPRRSPSGPGGASTAPSGARAPRRHEPPVLGPNLVFSGFSETWVHTGRFLSISRCGCPLLRIPVPVFHDVARHYIRSFATPQFDDVFGMRDPVIVAMLGRNKFFIPDRFLTVRGPKRAPRGRSRRKNQDIENRRKSAESISSSPFSSCPKRRPPDLSRGAF